MIPIKPMLAKAYKDCEHKIEASLPGVVQPKLDGIRCILTTEGHLFTRSGKQIPNQYITDKMKGLAEFLPFSLDGELLIGDPTDPKVYNKTSSGVMSHSGEPVFVYWAFDIIDETSNYQEREVKLRDWHLENPTPDWLAILSRYWVDTVDEMLHYVSEYNSKGHEGAIYRSAGAYYKHGRATPSKCELVKFKTYIDDEAIVVGFQELKSNQNEAFIDELGFTKHSSHQEGKVPMNTLGALICEYKGETIHIGTGFDQAQRQEIWDYQNLYEGKYAKFKYMPHGMKDKPRHPVFIGWRDERDM